MSVSDMTDFNRKGLAMGLQNGKLSRGVRICAIFVAVTLAGGPIGPASGQIPAKNFPPGFADAPFPIPDQIAVPSELGTVQSQQRGQPDQPFVVYIQDAHAITDAQDHIRGLIEYLQETYGFDLVALEGVRSRLDPTLFRAFPDEFVRKKIMGDYFNRAEISGAAISSVVSSVEADYRGLEDWALYKNNYSAYLRSLDQKETLLNQIRAVIDELDRRRETVYSEDMNRLHEREASFRAESSEVFDYLGFLAGQKRPPDFDAVYPELSALLRNMDASDADEAADLSDSVRRMAKAFQEKYLGLLDKNAAMEFNQKYQAFQTGGLDASGFLSYLVKTGDSAGLKTRLTPLMRKVLGQTETISAIKGTRLFDELDRYVRWLEGALCTTPEARHTARAYRQLWLLTDLASVALTREQFYEYQKDAESYLSLLGKARDAALPAVEFYRLAMERDRVFHENLEKLVRSRNRKLAVVVTGGFHAAGFEEELKQAGYSYAVIMPKIASLEGQEFYQEVMEGKLSYKKYFQKSLYDAFVKDATEKMMNELDAPKFRKALKVWRDNLIRQLAREGRLGQAGEYTPYIDRLLLFYTERHGTAYDDKPKTEADSAVQDVLDRFRENLLTRHWKKFEARLPELVAGLTALKSRGGLTESSVRAVLAGSKLAAMNPLAAGDAGFPFLESAAPSQPMTAAFTPTQALDALRDIARGTQADPAMGQLSPVLRAAEHLAELGQHTQEQIRDARSLPPQADLGAFLSNQLEEIQSSLPDELAEQARLENRNLTQTIAATLAENLGSRTREGAVSPEFAAPARAESREDITRAIPQADEDLSEKKPAPDAAGSAQADAAAVAKPKFQLPTEQQAANPLPMPEFAPGGLTPEQARAAAPEQSDADALRAEILSVIRGEFSLITPKGENPRAYLEQRWQLEQIGEGKTFAVFRSRLFPEDAPQYVIKFQTKEAEWLVGPPELSAEETKSVEQRVGYGKLLPEHSVGIVDGNTERELTVRAQLFGREIRLADPDNPGFAREMAKKLLTFFKALLRAGVFDADPKAANRRGHDGKMKLSDLGQVYPLPENAKSADEIADFLSFYGVHWSEEGRRTRAVLSPGEAFLLHATASNTSYLHEFIFGSPNDTRPTEEIAQDIADAQREILAVFQFAAEEAYEAKQAETQKLQAELGGDIPSTGLTRDQFRRIWLATARRYFQVLDTPAQHTVIDYWIQVLAKKIVAANNSPNRLVLQATTPRPSWLAYLAARGVTPEDLGKLFPSATLRQLPSMLIFKHRNAAVRFHELQEAISAEMGPMFDEINVPEVTSFLGGGTPFVMMHLLPADREQIEKNKDILDRLGFGFAVSPQTGVTYPDGNFRSGPEATVYFCALYDKKRVGDTLRSQTDYLDGLAGQGSLLHEFYRSRGIQSFADLDDTRLHDVIRLALLSLVAPRLGEPHAIIGLALGYPPVAVKAFVERNVQGAPRTSPDMHELLQSSGLFEEDQLADLTRNGGFEFAPDGDIDASEVAAFIAQNSQGVETFKAFMPPQLLENLGLQELSPDSAKPQFELPFERSDELAQNSTGQTPGARAGPSNDAQSRPGVDGRFSGYGAFRLMAKAARSASQRLMTRRDFLGAVGLATAAVAASGILSPSGRQEFLIPSSTPAQKPAGVPLQKVLMPNLLNLSEADYAAIYALTQTDAEPFRDILPERYADYRKGLDALNHPEENPFNDPNHLPKPFASTLNEALLLLRSNYPGLFKDIFGQFREAAPHHLLIAKDPENFAPAWANAEQQAMFLTQSFVTFMMESPSAVQEVLEIFVHEGKHVSDINKGYFRLTDPSLPQEAAMTELSSYAHDLYVFLHRESIDPFDAIARYLMVDQMGVSNFGGHYARLATRQADLLGGESGYVRGKIDKIMEGRGSEQEKQDAVQNVKVMYAAEKSNAVLFLYLGARLDAKKPERIQIRGVYAGSTSNPKTGETFHLFNIEYLDGEGNLRRAWVPVDPADRQNPERMRAIRQSLGEKGLSVRTVFGEALSFVDQALSEDESVSEQMKHAPLSADQTARLNQALNASGIDVLKAVEGMMAPHFDAIRKILKEGNGQLKVKYESMPAQTGNRSESRDENPANPTVSPAGTAAAAGAALDEAVRGLPQPFGIAPGADIQPMSHYFTREFLYVNGLEAASARQEEFAAQLGAQVHGMIQSRAPDDTADAIASRIMDELRLSGNGSELAALRAALESPGESGSGKLTASEMMEILDDAAGKVQYLSPQIPYDFEAPEKTAAEERFFSDVCREVADRIRLLDVYPRVPVSVPLGNPNWPAELPAIRDWNVYVTRLINEAIKNRAETATPESVAEQILMKMGLAADGPEFKALQRQLAENKITFRQLDTNLGLAANYAEHASLTVSNAREDDSFSSQEVRAKLAGLLNGLSYDLRDVLAPSPAERRRQAEAQAAQFENGLNAARGAGLSDVQARLAAMNQMLDALRQLYQREAYLDTPALRDALSLAFNGMERGGPDEELASSRLITAVIRLSPGLRPLVYQQLRVWRQNVERMAAEPAADARAKTRLDSLIAALENKLTLESARLYESFPEQNIAFRKILAYSRLAGDDAALRKAELQDYLATAGNQNLSASKGDPSDGVLDPGAAARSQAMKDLWQQLTDEIDQIERDHPAGVPEREKFSADRGALQNYARSLLDRLEQEKQAASPAGQYSFNTRERLYRQFLAALSDPETENYDQLAAKLFGGFVSADAVQERYRALAAIGHPDKAGGAINDRLIKAITAFTEFHPSGIEGSLPIPVASKTLTPPLLLTGPAGSIVSERPAPAVREDELTWADDAGAQLIRNTLKEYMELIDILAQGNRAAPSQIVEAVSTQAAQGNARAVRIMNLLAAFGNPGALAARAGAIDKADSPRNENRREETASQSEPIDRRGGAVRLSGVDYPELLAAMDRGEVQSFLTKAGEREQTKIAGELAETLNQWERGGLPAEDSVQNYLNRGIEFEIARLMDAAADLLQKQALTPEDARNVVLEIFSTLIFGAADAAFAATSTYAEQVPAAVEIDASKVDAADSKLDRAIADLLGQNRGRQITVLFNDPQDKDTTAQLMSVFDQMAGAVDRLVFFHEAGQTLDPQYSKPWASKLTFARKKNEVRRAVQNSRTVGNPVVFLLTRNDANLAGKDFGVLSILAEINKITDLKLRKLALKALGYAMLKFAILPEKTQAEILSNPALLRNQLADTGVLEFLNFTVNGFDLKVAEFVTSFAAAAAVKRAA